MNDWLKHNAWSLVIAAVTMISTFALYGIKIQNLEERADRQGVALTTVQTSLANTQSQYAALSAKIDAMNDLLIYIRNRIDK